MRGSLVIPCSAVVRVWSGRVPRGKADEYSRFLVEKAVPDYRGTLGNLGVLILRRDEGDSVRFTIITFWESIESIKMFAGDDHEKAKYYEEDKDYLLEFPEKVEHYSIVTGVPCLREK